MAKHMLTHHTGADSPGHNSDVPTGSGACSAADWSTGQTCQETEPCGIPQGSKQGEVSVKQGTRKVGGGGRGKTRKGGVVLTKLSQSQVKRARLERGCKPGYVMPSSSDDEYVSGGQSKQRKVKTRRDTKNSKNSGRQ